MSSVEPPPMSRTVRGPVSDGNEPETARHDSRASRSPAITCMRPPTGASAADARATKSAPFSALRTASVVTAATRAQPCRAMASANSAHDRDGARDRLLLEPAAAVEPLAQPHDLGALLDRPIALGDGEQRRVRPDIDRGDAHANPRRPATSS